MNIVFDCEYMFPTSFTASLGYPKSFIMMEIGVLFFSMEFGILSGRGVLLLAKYFRYKLYVSWSKYVYRGFKGFRVCL